MKLKHDLKLGRNFSRNKYCDVELTRDGSRSIGVHRVVLASVCPKLEAVFDSNYHSKAPLVVDDVDFNSLEKVVEFIYSGEIILGDNQEYDLVAEAMKKLQIDLSIVCEKDVVDDIESEIKEAEEDISNNNFVVSSENSKSSSQDIFIPAEKVPNSSRDTVPLDIKDSSSCISEPASMCPDLDLFDCPSEPDPVWKKVCLKVRTDLFKLPSHLATAFAPPSKPSSSTLVSSAPPSLSLPNRVSNYSPIRSSDISSDAIEEVRQEPKRTTVLPMLEWQEKKHLKNVYSERGAENFNSYGLSGSLPSIFGTVKTTRDQSNASGKRKFEDVSDDRSVSPLFPEVGEFRDQPQVPHRHIQATPVFETNDNVIVLSGKKKNRKRTQREARRRKSVTLGKQSNGVPNVSGKNLSHSTSEAATPPARLVYKFGGTGAESGKFRGPLAASFGANQLQYVVDSGNHRVQVFNPDSTLQFQFGAGHLILPNDIAIGGTASGFTWILISDKGDRRIKLFTYPSGQFVRILGLRLTGTPVAVSVNEKGTVVVAELRTKSRNIIVCDLCGNVFSNFEVNDTSCIFFAGLLLTNQEEIVIPCMITNTTNHSTPYYFKVFTYSGKFVWSFGCEGILVGISEVCQNLLVASLRKARLRLTLVTSKGKQLFTVNSEKTLPSIPCSFATISSSTVLRVMVGDKQDNVQIFTVSIFGQKFTNPLKYPQHQRSDHEERVQKCGTCDFTSFRKKDLRLHEFKEHKVLKPPELEELFSCDQCSYVSPHSNSVAQHKKDTHGRRKEGLTKAKAIKKVLKKAEWRLKIGWGPDDLFTCDNWNFQTFGCCRLEPGHTGKNGVVRNHVCALCFRHAKKKEKDHPAVLCQKFPLPPKSEDYVLPSMRPMPSVGRT